MPAQALPRGAMPAGGPRPLPVVRVPVEDALGRVTAEPVWARRSSPATPAPAMDGIAVSGKGTAGARGRPAAAGPAEFDVVDTGDPLPAGATLIPVSA